MSLISEYPSTVSTPLSVTSKVGVYLSASILSATSKVEGFSEYPPSVCARSHQSQKTLVLSVPYLSASSKVRGSPISQYPSTINTPVSLQPQK
ncbi:hypothetical protein CEXT_323171 [Caerostris extrusa]|uniref:Uncharacterized protein n=1 Tax=Caerostris extrusa TaxID=172846 RepID=A0AAV4N3F9_CAEEX|nr:hypothetical protein CEXT_323171 [Caerostris extrusa]